MSEQSTIESLAEKLAAAELTDDEVKLLVSLFADDEVAGFGSNVIEYQDGNDLVLRNPTSPKDWMNVLSARTRSR